MCIRDRDGIERTRKVALLFKFTADFHCLPLYYLVRHGHDLHREGIGLLDEMCIRDSRQHVRFVWVKGHADNAENNRCDALAVAASADGALLSEDTPAAIPKAAATSQEHIEGALPMR